MLLIVIFAILLFVVAILHYQTMVKKHQKTLYGKGGGEQEVISLDDEDTGPTHYAPPPSKSFILGSMGILVLVFFYYFFFHTPGAGDSGDFTYDELGMQALCEKLVADGSFERETKTLLLLPPYLQNEYITLEEGKKHPFVDDVLIDTILTKGRKFTIVDVASSAPFFSARDNVDGDYSLTATTLRDLLTRYEEPIQLVICLGGFKKDSQKSVKPADRSFYLAVFGDKPSFYPYLDLAKEEAFDLALISKGAYNINQAAPDDLAPQTIVDAHFLYISPSNERFVRGQYRQYIGVFPPTDNAFCK